MRTRIVGLAVLVIGLTLLICVGVAAQGSETPAQTPLSTVSSSNSQLPPSCYALPQRPGYVHQTWCHISQR